MLTSMTTLTQTWMTLLLSNVLPSDHNSDLPLLSNVYAILTRMSVHVAQVIVEAIYLFVGMPPTRHPLDPDKSNRALGFPALITSLYHSFGVPVTPRKVIRPPITRAFIEKYCMPRQVQGDATTSSGHRRSATTSSGRSRWITRHGALSTALGSPAGGQPPGAGADT